LRPWTSRCSSGRTIDHRGDRLAARNPA
jgi:hypothetical protein